MNSIAEINVSKRNKERDLFLPKLSTTIIKSGKTRSFRPFLL